MAVQTGRLTPSRLTVSDSHHVALTDNAYERSLTVLCIEDDSASLSLIAATIRERPDVELLVATDDAAGTKMARRHRPDLVAAPWRGAVA